MKKDGWIDEQNLSDLQQRRQTERERERERERESERENDSH